MKKWFVLNKPVDYISLSKETGLNPVVVKTLINRGIDTKEKIDNFFKESTAMHSPYQLKDIEKARDIILDKIAKGKKIRIVGDYDVDGITSTYILYDAFRILGADVSYRIPDRINDGYGINDTIVNECHDDGINTIVTCDNGIAARSQIELANSLGMTVVITDHHDIPIIDGKEIIPDAVAVVNPHRSDDKSEFKEICGAVVAYKLVQTLFEKTGKGEIEKYNDFITIATVCDVMELRNENRTIVKNGLKKLPGTSNVGLKALFNVYSLSEITVFHLGFVIGAALNATGRIKTADIALELLLCDDMQKALEKAETLKEINDTRKEMTKKGFEEALDYIDDDDKVIVVYLKDVHESLAGIIAGRIKEIYDKPAIVLTKTISGIVKGSCRSVEKYNISEALMKCNDLLIKFGGHPMAAGLSLEEKNFFKFKDRLNEDAKDIDFTSKVLIDYVLPFKEVTPQLIYDIQMLEPCGTGNEKPVIALNEVTLSGGKVLGSKRNAVRFVAKDKNKTEINAIMFCEADKFMEQLAEKFGKQEVDKLFAGLNNNIKLSIIYEPEINKYNGKETLQIRIKDWR